MKEFNLSKKNEELKEELKYFKCEEGSHMWRIFEKFEEAEKEFIKRLKIEFQTGIEYDSQYIDKKIDKFAGEKLK